MKYFLVIAILLSSTCCKAQTWDEWVHQRKTQIKYLKEQVIALQVYGQYIQEGYAIVQGGLFAIHDIKEGDFNLHCNYFSSLKKVSPSVATYSKASGIIDLQLQILQLNAAINKMLNSNSIQDNEHVYVKGVMKNILQKCADNIADLTTITTNGQAGLKDDERIKSIDTIYRDIKDKYAFTAHFKEQIALLALSRQKERGSNHALQSLYNLK